MMNDGPAPFLPRTSWGKGAGALVGNAEIREV